MTETKEAVEKAPAENKPKWYFAGQELAKQWLTSNSENNILLWQEVGKDRVIESYYIVKQGEGSTVIFTYSKTKRVFSVFESHGSMNF